MGAIAKNNGTLFDGSRVCLAPMAGYTDAPFRLLCFEFGADFAYTGMVSADGLVRGGDRTRRLLGRFTGEGPVGIQLFGSDPGIMADAARLAEEENPAFIDLNFGCSVRKVIRKNGGAALMRDLDLMGRICSRVVEAVTLPVTAKIRSGWSRVEENYMEAGRVLEEAGAAAVTLHPRFRTQGFSGTADWGHIAALGDSLSIPVIGNGDVNDADDYDRLIRTARCRIVMIGRGAFGRPWIFRDITNRIEGAARAGVGAEKRIAILERHIRMAVDWKGERPGVLEMRKHYRWYFRGIPGMKAFRRRLTTASSFTGVMRICQELREENNRKWKKLA